MLRRIDFPLTAMLAFALAACEPAPNRTSSPPPIRAVKTIAIERGEISKTRTFSGVIAASETMRLSFAVGGKLLDVPLREGERITAGQVVARLDPVDAEREIANANARLSAARSRQALADKEYRRQQSLFERGFVTRAAFDRVVAALEAARSDVNVAEIELDAARERLARTTLVAPNDGVVTRLLANRFEEIAAGVPVYEVAVTANWQAEVLVPEQLLTAIALESVVSVTLPALSDVELSARVSEIAAETEAGNAFRVKSRLEAAPEGMRSGLTAAVTFGTRDRQEGGIEIPLSALLIETTRSEAAAGRLGAVYVLDETAGVIARRTIRIDGLAGNQVTVAEGLRPDEQLVVAGVALLRDGQQARRWVPPE